MNAFKSAFIAGTVLAGAAALAPPAISAETERYDSSTKIAAQRAAMAPLARLDGQWRGTATIHLPSGETR